MKIILFVLFLLKLEQTESDYAPWLALANRFYIRRICLNGSESRILAKSFENAFHLDFDFTENQLYFHDAKKQRIYRMNWLDASDMDGFPKVDEILRHNVYGLEGLAVDWIGRKLYLLNKQDRTLRVCELNGTNCRVLLRNRSTQPRAICVHPLKGHVFFADWSLSPYIARLGMDGTEFMKIVQNDLGWPNALIIDYYSEKLFWGDAHLNEINYVNFDGSDRRRLNVKYTPHVYSLSLYNNWLYWTDWNLKQIYRAHKFNGTDEQLIASLVQLPNDLKVIHPSRQPPGLNPCGDSNGGCSHLCLIKPGGYDFSCLCPDYFILQSDKKTCIPNCSNDSQWQCGGNYQKCIPKLWVCDGEQDCADGLDEHENCTGRFCDPGLFQCDNEQCIRSYQLCDGTSDCSDKSDEKNCHLPCIEGMFKCKVNGKCIPERFVCDDDKDCGWGDDSDESDEVCLNPNRTCTDEQFKCDNNKCIPMAYRCDFDDDCGDKSDEPDECKNRTCPIGWTKCKSSYRCIPDWSYCNGHDDCRDNSDEQPDRCPACDPIGDFQCKFATDNLIVLMVKMRTNVKIILAPSVIANAMTTHV